MVASRRKSIIFVWSVAQCSVGVYNIHHQCCPPTLQVFPLVSSSQPQLVSRPRLARHGLQHREHCALQEDETAQLLLTSCILTRQVWFSVLSTLGLQALAQDHSNDVSSRIGGAIVQGLQHISDPSGTVGLEA
jgi:hypothetical protein